MRRPVVAALAALALLAAPVRAGVPSGCDWSAFGDGPAHTFAVPEGCSPVTAASVRTLVPAWFVPTSDSVTASPAVADGTAYVGDWDGTFYAVDVATGTVRWTHRVTGHAPTAFGRIVSSATVATWSGRSVVLFGGGSSLWALDATDGTELASIDLDPRTPALRAQQDASSTPPVVEVESSPAVATVDGVRRVYVGLDVHNTAHVGRTGLVALDLVHDDAGWRFVPLWKYDVETAQTYDGLPGLTAGSGQGWGCGGVWSSPAVGSGLVAFGTASCSYAAQAYDAHENYAESMVVLDAVTGQLRWRYRPADALPTREARIADAARDADFGASPNLFALAGRAVVGEGRKSGEYVVRDLLTGAPVSTTQAGQEGRVQPDFAVGGFLGTPAVAALPGGGTTVVGATAIPVPQGVSDLDRSTWAVRGLDPGTGRVTWTYRLAGPSYGHTSVVGGVALVPDTTTSSLLALDAATGALLWQLPVVGPPSSTAVVAGGTVLLGTGTRETDLEYKAVSHRLQDALTPVTGASPLSRLSGLQAFRLAP